MAIEEKCKHFRIPGKILSSLIFIFFYSKKTASLDITKVSN